MIDALPNVLCQGEKLCIRRFFPEDAPAIFAYSQEESIRRELPDEVLGSLEETRECLRQFNENADRLVYPLVLCAALRKSGEAVGHVSLSLLEAGKVEIGYAIGEAHQGKGYGGEAVRVFSQWALAQGNWPRLYGVVKEENAPSIRCLEAAGYQLLSREKRDCFGGRHIVREYMRKAR